MDEWLLAIIDDQMQKVPLGLSAPQVLDQAKHIETHAMSANRPLEQGDEINGVDDAQTTITSIAASSAFVLSAPEVLDQKDGLNGGTEAKKKTRRGTKGGARRANPDEAG
jgi:hypothetical protein